MIEPRKIQTHSRIPSDKFQGLTNVERFSARSCSHAQLAQHPSTAGDRHPPLQRAALSFREMFFLANCNDKVLPTPPFPVTKSNCFLNRPSHYALCGLFLDYPSCRGVSCFSVIAWSDSSSGDFNPFLKFRILSSIAPLV